MPSKHPDTGNEARNHYDWFMPSNPTAAVDDYLDEFEAKLTEALTDPFVHDMAQSVLPLIAAYRQSRAAAPRSGEGLDAENCAICGMTPHRCVTAEAAIERHSDIERARQLEDWERRVGRPPEGWGPMPELRDAARLRENTNAE